MLRRAVDRMCGQRNRRHQGRPGKTDVNGRLTNANIGIERDGHEKIKQRNTDVFG